MRVATLVIVLAGLLAASPSAVRAQAVRAGSPDAVVLRGQSDVALDRRLARLLATDPLILTADTRIREGDTVTTSVLLVDATLVHEGTILGDLVVVDGGAFVRHQAVVEGDLVNIGGGLYRSARARIGGHILDLPEASYHVRRERGRIVIEATEAPARLVLGGVLGLRTPTYDRVNGLTAAWGAGYRLPRLGNVTPTVRGHAGWRTELGEPVYGASMDLRMGAYTLDGGLARTWVTREGWAHRDIRNSLNYLWDGDDFRNYYDADRTWVGVTRALGDESKSFHAEMRLEAGMEDARSVAGDEPWHLLGDSTRANPAVDDGRITSARGSFETAWHGFRTDLTLGGEYEAGRTWQDGEFSFDRVAVRAHLAVAALFDHTLEIRGYIQMPVGADTLPRQRWSAVGGPGTLQTLDIGQRRGDHVAWLDTRYRIPLPAALQLPVLGAPELQLVHAAGQAWLADDDGTLTQEVGARLQFFGPYVQYMMQPSDPDRNRALIGLTWPFAPPYPWER